MKSKLQLYLTILLLLAVFILSVSFAIAPENITRVLAQDSSDTGDFYAVSSRGDTLDFKSMAIESAKTYLTDEYNNKLMPSRPPGEVEAFEILPPDGVIGNQDKPAKLITQSNTRGLPLRAQRSHSPAGREIQNCSPRSTQSTPRNTKQFRGTFVSLGSFVVGGSRNNSCL